MKHKKILSCFVSVIACGMFMVPVVANSSQNISNDGKYLVYVECTSDVTRHTINARNGASYPAGNAYVTHSLGGAKAEEISVNGTSFSSYWTATRYNSNPYENIISARTYGYGVEVKAAAK